MASDDEVQKKAQFLTDEDEPLIVITDWKIGSDGRLHIPQSKREKYGLGEGDYVDAILVPEREDGAQAEE